ncbi:holo-ACP synthase [Luteococcus peritonei]|uniref:Holo-ACP synthase n=1 Tax=Luteococcus peritonei TaxID=88874 RepID=A0ABW4RT48_9ACTN
MHAGIDLVEVAQVRDSLAHLGDRYLRGLHTEAELGLLRDGDASQLAWRAAERFAAKEAVFKALQIPSSTTVGWRCIELDDRLGVTLHGPARDWAEQHQVTTLQVSTTRSDGHAMAVALAG